MIFFLLFVSIKYKLQKKNKLLRYGYGNMLCLSCNCLLLAFWERKADS